MRAPATRKGTVVAMRRALHFLGYCLLMAIAHLFMGLGLLADLLHSIVWAIGAHLHDVALTLRYPKPGSGKKEWE